MEFEKTKGDVGEVGEAGEAGDVGDLGSNAGGAVREKAVAPVVIDEFGNAHVPPAPATKATVIHNTRPPASPDSRFTGDRFDK